MVLGAQVVGAVFMAELVDEQPYHVLGDAMLEPVRAKLKLFEDQCPAGAIRGSAEMMRRGENFTTVTS